MVFKGRNVRDQKGTTFDAEEVVNAAKVTLVYFSAHWCPPCRGFTPKLKDFYKEAKDLGVCVIFSSCDETAEGMDEYFKEHGTYYAIPFEDEDFKNLLEGECGLGGIPSLCVVNKEGKCKYKDARKDVEAVSDINGDKKEEVGKIVEKWADML